MKKLQKEKLLFGSSVTVTTDNLEEVTTDEFIEKLEQRDCKALIFKEKYSFDKAFPSLRNLLENILMRNLESYLYSKEKFWKRVIKV